MAKGMNWASGTKHEKCERSLVQRNIGLGLEKPP